MKIIRPTSLAFIVVLFTHPVFGVLELKTNFLPTFAMVGRSDLNLSTQNTILFGGGSFRIGPYLAYEIFGENVTDQAYGLALRIGQNKYFELQGGYFERRFKQKFSDFTGRGMIANLGFGTHLSEKFGLALFLSGKRIEEGMEPRWIYDLLPYLHLRMEL